jgi:hypothetical protein
MVDFKSDSSGLHLGALIGVGDAAAVITHRRRTSEMREATYRADAVRPADLVRPVDVSQFIQRLLIGT